MLFYPIPSQQTLCHLILYNTRVFTTPTPNKLLYDTKILFKGFEVNLLECNETL